MRKKYIFLTAFLIAFLISLFSSCTKAPEEKNKAEASSTETLQENRSSQKRQRRRRGTQLAEIAQPGQGQMKREGHAQPLRLLINPSLHSFQPWAKF